MKKVLISTLSAIGITCWALSAPSALAAGPGPWIAPPQSTNAYHQARWPQSMPYRGHSNRYQAQWARGARPAMPMQTRFSPRQPTMQAQRPPLRAYRPMMQAQRPPMRAFRPMMQTQRPPMRAFRPMMQAQRPPMRAFRPRMQTQRPPMRAFRPMMQAQRPPIGAFRPTMQAQRPPLRALQPMLQAQRPQWRGYAPRLVVQAPMPQSSRAPRIAQAPSRSAVQHSHSWRHTPVAYRQTQTTPIWRPYRG
jgi:hypothetical protein